MNGNKTSVDQRQSRGSYPSRDSASDAGYERVIMVNADKQILDEAKATELEFGPNDRAIQ